MAIRQTGRYVPGALHGGAYRAFVPDALPPEPPILFAHPDLLQFAERDDQAPAPNGP